MSFFIIAVFIFFTLVGMFFIGFYFNSLKGSVSTLEKNQAIASLQTIANMPEFNCNSREEFCLDENKLRIMTTYAPLYRDFLPVESIKVYKLYPRQEEQRQCPGVNCSYYVILESTQKNVKEVSTFVSICKKDPRFGYVFDDCEIGKLVVGVRQIGE